MLRRSTLNGAALALVLSSALLVVPAACGAPVTTAEPSQRVHPREMLGTWSAKLSDGKLAAWYFRGDGFFHAIDGLKHFG